MINLIRREERGPVIKVSGGIQNPDVGGCVEAIK